jgi:hypothetical protein
MSHEFSSSEFSSPTQNSKLRTRNYSVTSAVSPNRRMNTCIIREIWFLHIWQQGAVLVDLDDAYHRPLPDLKLVIVLHLWGPRTQKS